MRLYKLAEDVDSMVKYYCVKRDIQQAIELVLNQKVFPENNIRRACCILGENCEEEVEFKSQDAFSFYDGFGKYYSALQLAKVKGLLDEIYPLPLSTSKLITK